MKEKICHVTTPGGGGRGSEKYQKTATYSLVALFDREAFQLTCNSQRRVINPFKNPWIIQNYHQKTPKACILGYFGTVLFLCDLFDTETFQIRENFEPLLLLKTLTITIFTFKAMSKGNKGTALQLYVIFNFED